jgi:hypothetical protein
LRKPEVKAAFIDHLKRSVRARREAPSTAPSERLAEASLEAAWKRLQRPSGWLLATGIFYTTLVTVAGLILIAYHLYAHPPTAANADDWLLNLLVVFTLIAQGPIIIMGALKMRDLESYGWALAGSIVALVPTSPLAVLGLPVGIWALAVLTSPETRAAFLERAARAAPTDSELT